MEIFSLPNRPSANYQAIAKVESHISKNMFFGGKASLTDDAYKELRAKACQLGGEAILIEDSIETGAAEMTHVHVWATVLRRSR